MAILLVLVAIAAEIAVWVGVAHFISGWWIFLWTAIAFFAGLNILRASVAGIMPQLQQMQVTGQVNDPQVSKNLPKALAGFLLMLPGLISDVLALLVLIPAVQQYLQRSLMSAMQKRQQSMMEKMMGGMSGGTGGDPADMMAEMMRRMQEMQQGGGSTPHGGHRPTVIDGEARHVEPEIKRIKPANDGE